MTEPLSQEQQQALNQDVTERMKSELGNLLQQIIFLQAHNAFLKRENDRLAAIVSKSVTSANDVSDRLIR